MTEGFHQPDVLAPLELDARLSGIPKDANVKGMFLSSLVDHVEARTGERIGRKRYVAFVSYPLAELLELLPKAAELVHPNLPVREGMRRLGQAAYPTFADSTLGRVLMSIAGSDPRAALHLAPRAYRLVGNTGEARVVDVDDCTSILELRGVWSFPDAYNVGVHEGALEAFGQDGEVRVRVHSISDVDLEIRWWAKGSTPPPRAAGA
jgi:uncharacterized protein (TIGR02265 family)